MFSPSVSGNQPTMASADFCTPIPTPYDASSQRQEYRSPKVMRVTFPLIPAAYTTTVSVQVSGFEDNGLLTHCDCLLCDSCSSGQCFAFSFLQIPPRDGHPCRSANRSPCRADSGLSPPSHPASTTCTGTAPVGATRHTWRTTKKPPLRAAFSETHAKSLAISRFCLAMAFGASNTAYHIGQSHHANRRTISHYSCIRYASIGH